MKSDADTRDLLKLRRAFSRESTPVGPGASSLGPARKGRGLPTKAVRCYVGAGMMRSGASSVRVEVKPERGS